MGILRQGIFGGFEKRTGPLVGRKVGGNNVISVLRHKNFKLKTTAQLEHQLKFAMVVAFLRGFKNLIAVGFRHAKGMGNSFNAAMKYNFKNILIETAAGYAIDYTKVVYSKGKLAGPSFPSVTISNNVLQIRWLPDVQSQFNRYTDKANFLVYCPGKRITAMYPDWGVRSSLGCDLILPVQLDGHELHCWMSFASADEKVVSGSMYLG